MNEQEQNLADELEQLIKAAQANQASSPQHLTPTEADLAQNLVTLSQTSNPSPAFVTELRGRLKKRATELQTKKIPPENATIWRRLQNMFTGDSNMKRSYALGAVLALVIFAGLFILGRGFLDNTSSQVAAVTPDPVATLPSDIEETETAVSPTEAPSQPSELAQLPRLESQALAGGMGGGGTEGSTELDKMSMMMADPFSGTNFIMNATLPIDPVSGLVQQRLTEATIAAAAARQLADQYGFSGPIYVETYPSDVPTEGPGAPPTTYITFDGPRTLRFDPWSINYTDDAAAAKIDFENAQPLPNAAALAEAFLQARGQLNFPYEVEVQPWGDVFFYRTVNGTAVLEPEITVTLNPDGEVAFAFDNVSTDWTDSGSYPLISADQAWQQVLAGVTQNNIMYQTIVNEQSQPEPIVEPDFMADYQYWSRVLTPNTETHFYDWPQVYRPVDGGAPIIKVRNITINAPEDILNAIADSRDSQLHLWGVLSADGTQLQLTDWQALSEYNPIYQQGVITRQGDQVIFQGNEGDTFILPDAPADLADGLAVNVFGNGVRDTGLAYPVLDWENIDKYIEYSEDPILAEPPLDGQPTDQFIPFHYGQVQIDMVELAYIVTYLWPEESMVGGDAVVNNASPTIFLQPAWAFRGTADNGDTIHLFVQAVAPEFLQP
ncbi:MAG: hypothetical protein IAF02_08910 [Anaerolineae bacterium]|nr:hypothetical protein [Anaerolineae bacterium]